MRLNLFHHCQMDRGREDIICRLRFIDVVIRMDRMLTPQFTPQHLNCAVRNNFIDIHIRLRTTTCLPNTERKVVIQCTLNNFFCCRANRFRKFRIKQTEIRIHLCDCLFDSPKCPYRSTRQAFITDLKILERTLRLRTPIPVTGNFECPHAVCFSSHKVSGFPFSFLGLTQAALYVPQTVSL